LLQQRALREDHRMGAGEVVGKGFNRRRHEPDLSIFSAQNRAQFTS
jgi:hypothetical protein